MDFLKTLMLYMTLTFAGGVQAAPTPEVTAVPTATPTVIVEIAGTTTPDATAEITATATPAAGEALPTVAVTAAPAPTMTPNPAYKNLQSGDRGENVKTLQQRLKDLGYLTGDVDGAYGNQTRRAVLRFQYYNGLQQDGVAGKRTQTVLFESEDVVVSPDITPTPAAAPSETPGPSAAPAEALPTASDPTAEPTVVPQQTEGTEAVQPLLDASAAPAAAEALTLVPDASIVVNSSGEALHSLVMEDGVQVDRKPPLYVTAEDEAVLDLAAFCGCLADWTLTGEDADAWTLTAADYQMTILRSADAWSLTVNGTEAALAPGDLQLDAQGTLLMRAGLLDEIMNAQTLWDAEENTLMIHYTANALAVVDG